MKVRSYPTRSQRKLIEKLFKANRYAYNLLVEVTQGKWHLMTPKEMMNELRPLIQKGNVSIREPKFAYCPDECLDSALREFIKNCKANITQTQQKVFKEALKQKYKNENPPPGTKLVLTEQEKAQVLLNIVYPDLKYKRQRDNNTQLEIKKVSLKHDLEKGLRIYPMFFGKTNFVRIKTDLVQAGVADIPHSVTLCKHQGQYYFMFPHHKAKSAAPKRVCALDPGVRTFLSGYDPEGVAFEISSDQRMLYSNKRCIEHLQARLAQERDKKSIQWIKKKIRYLYQKIANRVADMHHKTAKVLSETYSDVLLPSLKVRSLVAKEGRKIGSSTSYMFLTLGHYKFRQLLKQKIESRQGRLHECTEEYSSKTCGNCGKLHYNLGANKSFLCPYSDCAQEIDRDLNAARNILIMNYEFLKC